MTLRVIPLAATPNQSLSVVLNGRNVTLTLRTLRGDLFVDVIVGTVPVCLGRAARDRLNLTTRAAQLGFPDLVLFFADLRGTSDPDWRKLGDRFVLVSDEPDITTP